MKTSKQTPPRLVRGRLADDAGRNAVRRGIQLGATATAVAVCLTACGSSGKTTSTQASTKSGSGAPYKVVIISEETGSVTAAVGVEYAQGLEAYFGALNKAGGINGHKIDYGTPLDGQSTESGDATAIRTALAEKPDEIVGLVGYLQSSTSLLKSAGIPVVAAQLPDPSWALVKPFPWYYSPIGDFVEPYVQGFKTLLGGSLTGKKVDFISYNIPTEVAEVKATQKGVIAEGGKAGVTDLVDPTQLSFTSEAATIAADHPAGVAMYLVGPGPKQVAQDLKNDGFDGPIINFAPGADPATITSVGLSNFYGERYTTLPGATALPEKTAKAAGISIGSQSDLGQGWVNGAIAATGLRGCSPTDCKPSAVEQALNSKPTTAPGVLFGPITYTATNHLGNMTFGYYHFNSSTKAIDLSGAPVFVNSDGVAAYYGLK